MLQATGSHAGKTVLVAGLCRLLARRGLRVRPFKSQNMSLNAHVAEGGGEMGWAQVMQAEAAGVHARVEMNPILLKPRAEARSQVVLLGRVLQEVDAVGYYRLTPRLWPAVRRSYETLAREADVVVIEGAGSPAEPNLMRRDLANVRVARLAGTGSSSPGRPDVTCWTGRGARRPRRGRPRRLIIAPSARRPMTASRMPSPTRSMSGSWAISASRKRPKILRSSGRRGVSFPIAAVRCGLFCL
jgi:hypothetical protein